MTEKDLTHEAWGCIGISHTYSNGTRLFRSPVRAHAYVTLRIHRASIIVDDGHYVPGSRHFEREPIVEVALSAVQFAELLTHTNQGIGVPCTIQRLGWQSVPPPPEEIDDIQAAADHAGNRGVAETAKLLDKVLADLAARAATGKPLGKKDIEELRRNIETAKTRCTVDLDYWRQDLTERAHATRAKVSAELHATADLLVKRLGIEALKAKVLGLLPGGKDSE